MRDFAIWRIAIFVAGLILAFAVPPAPQAQAQTAGQPKVITPAQKSATKTIRVRQYTKSARKSSRQSVRIASAKRNGQVKTEASAARTEPGPAKTDVKIAAAAAAIPDAVANANAQAFDSDQQAADAASAQSTSDASVPDARNVVAADQVNDIDRAASGMPPPRPMGTTVENRDDTDLAQTSMIGRIFIAIGGLLTVGSAVRMFIA